MKRILIIEDDEDTLELLGTIAEKSNLEVVLQTNVLPLPEIEKINPDLILLDHWIAEEKGGDLCLRLKRNQRTQEIPVVMISALNEIGQIAYSSGADGSLSKPFDIEQIESVFEAYLE